MPNDKTAEQAASQAAVKTKFIPEDIQNIPITPLRDVLVIGKLYFLNQAFG